MQNPHLPKEILHKEIKFGFEIEDTKNEEALAWIKRILQLRQCSFARITVVIKE